jgi:hypothetical protein
MYWSLGYTTANPVKLIMETTGRLTAYSTAGAYWAPYFYSTFEYGYNDVILEMQEDRYIVNMFIAIFQYLIDTYL